MPYVTPIRRAELCKRLTGLINTVKAECPDGATPELISEVISSLTTGIQSEDLPLQIRQSVDELSALVVSLGNNVGDYNYLITSILDGFIIGDKVSYGKINTAIGIMDFVSYDIFPLVAFMDNIKDMISIRGVYRCVQLELYRRLAGPYEDTKVEENGDVYKDRE